MGFRLSRMLAAPGPIYIYSTLVLKAGRYEHRVGEVGPRIHGRWSYKAVDPVIAAPSP